jgi:DNA-directed RNA polymerase sigma subunit (sigma70/sigma32)
MVALTKENVLNTCLTPREQQVLLLLAEGLTVAAIARQGDVLALGGRKQPLTKTRIYQIKTKALRRMRWQAGDRR